MATGARVPRRGLFYGWYIVGAATLNGAAIIGMTIYGFGVFLPSIRDDMGWSTAAIAFGFTSSASKTDCSPRWSATPPIVPAPGRSRSSA